MPVCSLLMVAVPSDLKPHIDRVGRFLRNTETTQGMPTYERPSPVDQRPIGPLHIELSARAEKSAVPARGVRVSAGVDVGARRPAAPTRSPDWDVAFASPNVPGNLVN